MWKTVKKFEKQLLDLQRRNREIMIYLLDYFQKGFYVRMFFGENNL